MVSLLFLFYFTLSLFTFSTFFLLIISAIYGKDPYALYGQDLPGLLNDYGYPIAPNGGISSQFWFGVEPSLGRDVFTQLVYGIRTSLAIAVISTIITTVIGIVVGIVAGYAGGKTDYFVGRLIDLTLSFPQTIFIIAFIPVVDSLLVSPDEETPTLLRAVTLTIMLTAFGRPGYLRRAMEAGVSGFVVKDAPAAAKGATKDDAAPKATQDDPARTKQDDPAKAGSDGA